eukprot:366196-Chlamydomonas_euryale.AAC.1
MAFKTGQDVCEASPPLPAVVCMDMRALQRLHAAVYVQCKCGNAASHKAHIRTMTEQLYAPTEGGCWYLQTFRFVLCLTCRAVLSAKDGGKLGLGGGGRVWTDRSLLKGCRWRDAFLQTCLPGFPVQGTFCSIPNLWLKSSFMRPGYVRQNGASSTWRWSSPHPSGTMAAPRYGHMSRVGSTRITRIYRIYRIYGIYVMQNRQIYGGRTYIWHIRLSTPSGPHLRRRHAALS